MKQIILSLGESGLVSKELLRRILAKPKDGVCQKLMIIVIACPTDARRARSESTKPQRDSYGTIS